MNTTDTSEVLYSQRKKYKRKNKIKLNLWCWAFLTPTLIFYLIFQGWPIISSIYYSFLNWTGLTSNAKFIGIGNYTALLKDKNFWNAFFNSFKYAIIYVPLQLVVSLVLAYILNSKSLKGSSFYRTLFFVPVITTSSIVGIVMVFIWSVQGPINSLLVNIGVLSSPINFLGNGAYAMATVIIIGLWKDCGTYMIYWLAGLQSVSEDVLEAAKLDGAGQSRTFFSIVLPLIKPVAGVITTLCFINSLKVFDIIKTMTDGGPFFSTEVIATYVYRMAFSSDMGMPRLGYASAAATFFGAVVIIIGILLNGVKNKLSKDA